MRAVRYNIDGLVRTAVRQVLPTAKTHPKEWYCCKSDKRRENCSKSSQGEHRSYVHGAVLTCRKSRLHSEGERLRAGLMSSVSTWWVGIL